MKFSRWITFNSTQNPEWRKDYIWFKQLKKYVKCIGNTTFLCAEGAQFQLSEMELREQERQDTAGLWYKEPVISLSAAFQQCVMRINIEVEKTKTFFLDLCEDLQQRWRQLDEETFDEMEKADQQQKERWLADLKALYHRVERAQAFSIVNKLAVMKIARKMFKAIMKKCKELLAKSNEGLLSNLEQSDMRLEEEPREAVRHMVSLCSDVQLLSPPGSPLATSVKEGHNPFTEGFHGSRSDAVLNEPIHKRSRSSPGNIQKRHLLHERSPLIRLGTAVSAASAHGHPSGSLVGSATSVATTYGSSINASVSETSSRSASPIARESSHQRPRDLSPLGGQRRSDQGVEGNSHLSSGRGPRRSARRNAVRSRSNSDSQDPREGRPSSALPRPALLTRENLEKLGAQLEKSVVFSTPSGEGPGGDDRESAAGGDSDAVGDGPVYRGDPAEKSETQALLDGSSNSRNIHFASDTLFRSVDGSTSTAQNWSMSGGLSRSHSQDRIFRKGYDLEDADDYSSSDSGADDSDFAAVRRLTSEVRRVRHELSQLAFFQQTNLTTLLRAVEDRVAILSFGGNHDKATRELREPRVKYNHWDTFILAFFLGINFTLFIVLWIVYFLDGDVEKNYSVNDPAAVGSIYRGLGLFILYLWFWGGDLLIWRKSSINHVYLLDFDPFVNLSWLPAWKCASVLTFMWLVSAVVYLGASNHLFDVFGVSNTNVYPLILLCAMVTFFVMPLPFLPWKTRKSLIQTLYHLLITPFGNVRFREFFAADQLTSMVVPLQDTQYMICYFTTSNWMEQGSRYCKDVNEYAGPCLAFVPYLWRFLQCLKKYGETRARSHLLNAGKYFSAFLVILFSTLHNNLGRKNWDVFRWLWIFCVIVSTLYAYCWDIRMDWGLWRRSSSGSASSSSGSSSSSGRRPHPSRSCRLKPPLRKVRLYSWTPGYYIAMVSNFVFRCAWAVTITQISLLPHDYFLAVLGSLELFRRCQWNLFRLENEMVGNEENYRQTLTVPQYLQSSDD